MNHIDIKRNCRGYNITSAGTPRGIPVHHGVSVRFVHGIPGFEQVRSWQFRANPELHPFLYMTALDESVRFVCVDVFRICPDYRLYLPDGISEPLGITTASRLAVLSIVTVGTTPESTTANLMSPIVINLDGLLGEQAIQETTPYPLRYSIWESLNLANAAEESSDELMVAAG